MPTLDYQSHPPHLARKPGSRAAVVVLLLVPAVMLGGGWFFARRPVFLPTQSLPASPPKYYQPDELIALEDFRSWSILKYPTVPGPYAVLESQMQPQSAAGHPLLGWIGTPRGSLTIDVPGIPDTSLLAVGVVNPAGQHGFFVLSRYEGPPATTTRPAAIP